VTCRSPQQGARIPGLEPPLLKRLPRVYLDSSKEPDAVAARWAERFNFRGVVRNVMAAVPLPDGNILTIRATGTVSFTADLGPQVYTLRFNLGGRYEYSSQDSVVSGAPNLLLPQGARIRGAGENTSILFVDIGCGAIARAFGAETRPAARMGELPGHFGAMLRESAFNGCREADRMGASIRPQYLRNFQNTMAASLATLLRELGPELRAPDPMIGRRKVDDLREWAALDHEEIITVGDLATRCGLGLRALQKNFLRHFDTTPHLYLRGLRLDKCRRLIQTGNCTVTEAAVDAGFAHFGHFSAAYHEKFGELPSATLRETKRVR
jgi:AraC-like DNA-binding protein